MKKKISDMMDCIQDDTVQLDIKAVTSLERIKEVTMNSIQGQKKASKRRFSLVRIALIAAVFILAGSATALAVVSFTQYEEPTDMLQAFFGEDKYSSGDGIVEYETLEYDGVLYEKLVNNLPAWERVPINEEQIKALAPYICGVNGKINYEDYTLTVEACLYDSRIQSGLLYYTIENPNGISGYSISPNGMLVWPEGSPIYAGFSHPEMSYIDDSKTTDTKLYVCSHFILVEDWGHPYISIGDGSNRDDKNRLAIELFDEGLPGKSLDNENIKLSPIGIEINGAGLGIDIDGIDYLSLKFIDDSEYILIGDFVDNCAYALLHEGYGALTCLFNRVIDTESVTEIVIEDMVLEVE